MNALQIALLIIAFLLLSGSTVILVFRLRRERHRADQLQKYSRHALAHSQPPGNSEEYASRLDLIIESTNLGFWDWTPQTGELLLNEQSAQLIGHTLEELQPVSIETWRKCCAPEDLKQAREFFNTHLNHEPPHYEQQVRLRHKDGHWIWVQLRGKIVGLDSQSRPTRVVGTAMDISRHMETKQLLLQSLSEFEAIFENSQVGVVYLKKDRRIARANTKFSELTGYETWELIGESVDIFHGDHERSEAFRERYYDELKSNGIMHLEYDLYCKDGSLLPCLLSGKAVDATDPDKGIIWIMEDLHQLQQAQTQINRQNALLMALIDLHSGLYSLQRSGWYLHGLQQSLQRGSQTQQRGNNRHYRLRSAAPGIRSEDSRKRSPGSGLLQNRCWKKRISSSTRAWSKNSKHCVRLTTGRTTNW